MTILETTTDQSHARKVDPDAYLDGIRSLLPAIRARSAEAETLRRMPADTVDELDEAGVFVALQPKRWGGLELDPVTHFRGVVLLASACAAAGWVGGVVGAHPWEVACMHPEAQHDVWETNPRARVSSSYAPTGTARRVDGGFILDGRWSFSSGVDICDWAILGALITGEPEAGSHALLIGRPDFTVDQDSWHVTGLAGTGSKDVIVDNAFVPEYRTHAIDDLRNPGWQRPGWELNTAPLYRLPWMNIFSWSIASPALGAASGLVDEYLNQSTTRKPAFGGPPVAKKAELHLRLAEAISHIDMMTQSMVASWAAMYSSVLDGGSIVDERAALRSRYAAARTIANSLDAALTVFAQAGGGAMNIANPIQQFLRDLLAMRNHPMATLERFAADQANYELLAKPETYK